MTGFNGITSTVLSVGDETSVDGSQEKASSKIIVLRRESSRCDDSIFVADISNNIIIMNSSYDNNSNNNKADTISEAGVLVAEDISNNVNNIKKKK